MLTQTYVVTYFLSRHLQRVPMCDILAPPDIEGSTRFEIHDLWIGPLVAILLKLSEGSSWQKESFLRLLPCPDFVAGPGSVSLKRGRGNQDERVAHFLVVYR